MEARWLYVRAMRYRRPSPLTVDRALAVVLTVLFFVELAFTKDAQGHRLAVGLLWPLLIVAVAFRRGYPTIVGILAASIAVVEQTFWPSQMSASAIAWMCDLYAVTVWSPPRRFAAFLGLYVVSSALPLAGNDNTKANAFFAIVSTTVLLLVRVVVGDRERRTRLAERERDVASREAVVEERARIARELHDVIAHHVSMIVLQAGAERHALGDGESSTGEVLGTIERTGRDALVETRRLLGMLRENGKDPLTPQPGLNDLDTLVGQVREAGLPVELHVDGERPDLPAGLELSAYRIVQEALTNALKHAGDATAAVRVRYEADVVELEITDDGGGDTPGRPGSDGHGLVGMRERVALYNGSFEARPRESGGYLVRVLLPIR